MKEPRMTSIQSIASRLPWRDEEEVTTLVSKPVPVSFFLSSIFFSDPVTLLQLERQVHLRQILKPVAAERLNLRLGFRLEHDLHLLDPIAGAVYSHTRVFARFEA